MGRERRFDKVARTSAPMNSRRSMSSLASRASS